MDLNTAGDIVGSHLRQTGRLLCKYDPMLAAILLGARLLEALLMRLANWLGRWSWVSAAHLIGPQDGQVWMLAAIPLNLLFGMPGQLRTGVAVVAVQFCVLAAGLSLAVTARAASAQPIASA